MSKHDLALPEEDFWHRHIDNAVALYPYVKDWPHFIDMGSGTGIPGIVLGILLQKEAYLVESRLKKALFLKDVIHTLNLPLHVLHARLEAIPSLPSPYFISRAFRPLLPTLELMKCHLTPQTTYVCLKGKRYEEEVTEARKAFRFKLEVFPNVTHPEGCILRLTNITP